MYIIVQNSLGFDSLSKNFLLVQRDQFSQGSFYFLFSGRKREIRMPFLHLLFFHVPLAQSNLYAKVACFGVAYSDTFQCFPGLEKFRAKGKQYKARQESPEALGLLICPFSSTFCGSNVLASHISRAAQHTWPAQSSLSSEPEYPTALLTS